MRNENNILAYINFYTDWNTDSTDENNAYYGRFIGYQFLVFDLAKAEVHY